MALNNDRLLEGLYGLGVPVQTLMSIDKNLPPEDFKRQLANKGVQPVDFQRAEGLVNLRTDGPPKANALKIMQTMGVQPDTFKQFNQLLAGNNDPKSVLAVLQDLLGPERAGNIMTKATGGKPPEGTVWNPYRGDAPPDKVNVKYGAMGVITGLGASGGDLPQPLTPVQQKQAAATAAKVGGTTLPAPSKTPGGPGAGGGGAAGGGGGGGAGALGTGQRAAGDVDTYLAQNYGHLSYLLSIPEVANIVKTAREKGWGDDEIEGAITGSQWWKTTTDSKRLWQDQKTTDPASAARSLDAQVQNLRTSSQKYGIQIDDARLRQIAETSLEMGWTSAQSNEALSKEFHYQAGQSTAIVGRLKDLAGDYYIPLSDGALQQWGQSIIAGGGDESQFNQYVKDQAKSMFPTAAGAIDRGVTVKAFTDPYRQIASQTLELDPDSINFSDPKYLAALNQPDPKTGDHRLMSLSEWSDHIKKDDRYGWDQTQNARNEATDMAQKITKVFGGGL